ncbi:hypothetical protein [Streptomyces sp. 147326]|uniref:hypothetical protein n=1 Tax=Streptomyces sp. 147326 TaxID=3074379 RepID=UPI0038578066
MHAVQLGDPSVPYSHERDRETARASREALLARAREHGALVATAHLTRAFVEPPGEASPGRPC